MWREKMDKNMKILVVDDFSTMRRIVRNLLVELGFTNTLIQEADDGNNALVMLTAENNRDQIIAAAQAGVNGYIVKPFNAVTLKEKLTKIFERLAAAGA